MTIEVAIRRKLGAFELDASFSSPGGVTALFGASGSGKTSVVNIIAGLMHPDEGRIAVDGRVLVDTERRIRLPAHRRRIGYVFQDARLFPHLTVRQNLLYGRHFAPRGEPGQPLDDVVDLLGIGHLLARKPELLSGGEKQRVGIGRALLSKPALILMDEPLASLDDARKAEILPYLERLRDAAGVPIIYVSHSVAEVARLASRVVIMANGKVVASGPAGDMLQRYDLLPETERAEAGTLLTLTVTGRDQHGLTELRSAAGTWWLAGLVAPEGTRVRVRVRARDVMLSLEPLSAVSALNRLDGIVQAIEPAGPADALVRVDCSGELIFARVTRRSVESLGLAPGRPVQAVVKSVTLDQAG